LGVLSALLVVAGVAVGGGAVAQSDLSGVFDVGATTPASFVYTGAGQCPTAVEVDTATGGGGTPVNVTAPLAVITCTNNVNAGQADFKIKFSVASDNWAAGDSIRGKFTIGKADNAHRLVDTSAALKAWFDTVNTGTVNYVSVNSGNVLVSKAPNTANGIAAKSGITGLGAISYVYIRKNGSTWDDSVIVTADNVKDAGEYALKISIAEGNNVKASVMRHEFSLVYLTYQSSPLLTSIPRSTPYSKAAAYFAAWPTVVSAGIFGTLDSIYNITAELAQNDGSYKGVESPGAYVLNRKKITNDKSAGLTGFSIVDTGGTDYGVKNGVGTVRLRFDAKGKGIGSESKKVWFAADSMDVHIAEMPLADSMIQLTDYPIIYTGADIADSELLKKFFVIQDGQLKEGADQDFEILAPTLNRKNAGVNQAWIEIEGRGNYSGTARKQFTIERKALTVAVSVLNAPKVYSGKPDLDTNSFVLSGGVSVPNTVSAYAAVGFAGLADADSVSGGLKNLTDYEIKSAKYSDSVAGAVCSLAVRVALKNSALARNYKFAGASGDSTVAKAYGLEIAKLTVDSTHVSYVIPTNHYYNGAQRGIAAPALKEPLKIAGGTLTVLYRYPAGMEKPDFDTTIASLAVEKDTAYAPKKPGVYGVFLKVAGSVNLNDAAAVELGSYTIKSPAGPTFAFPTDSTAAEALNLLVRQGRSVSLKVSATSPNGGVLTYKWHTVEDIGGRDTVKALNIAGLVTTDSVLTVTVSGAVGDSTRYRALVTNTAPAGVQDPRAVASWTQTFTVKVDDPPISIVNAKLVVDTNRVWYYTGFPIMPSGTDVAVLLPGSVIDGDTAWDERVESDQYALSYTTNTNVGTATVRATAVLTGKYQGSVSAVFEILRKQFSVVDIAYAAERTYTGDTLDAQVRPNPPMTGMGEISVRYGESAGAPVNAGNYDVYVSVAGGSNVSSSNGFQYLGAYTISKLKPAAANLNYTKPETFNHVEGDSAAVYGIGGVTLKAAGYEGDIVVYYNSDTEVPTTAGSYTVTVDISGDDNVEQASAVLLGVYKIRSKSDAVVQADREVPGMAVTTGQAAIAPVKIVAASFSAGPSPVSKAAGKITFFSAKPVTGGSLYVFDVSGNAVSKVSVKQGYGKEIGSWNLRDGKGATVSEGSYIAKGVLIRKDGTREKVSFVFGVVK
jgi:hypothetical protein